MHNIKKDIEKNGKVYQNLKVRMFIDYMQANNLFLFMSHVFVGWLQPCAEDPIQAYCKVCKSTLRAHKTDLERLSERSLHKENFKILNLINSKQQILTNVTVINNKRNEFEIKIAAFIAANSNINSYDHLTGLVKQLSSNERSSRNDIDNIKLHRTKCTMIIKNVIAESLKNELVQDIEDNTYSLLIDESTDIAVVKYLCLCIRYYSTCLNRIVIQYLGLIKITRVTAEVLTQFILEFLLQLGLNKKNLIGLGTDGANNLCDKHHSVFTLLTKNALEYN